ncbi:MAG: HAD-IB family hydrolase [Spirochaetales bacterium]|nr:MAG: HAD-IB family hydrolase [Spirochaetales bacterium]
MTGEQFAIFDVDHTITRKSTGRRLVQCGRRSGICSISDLLKVPVLYAKYRRGTLQLDGLTESIDNLAGRTREELSAVARECFKRYITGDVMPGARDLVQAHLSAGEVVIFATSSIDLVIEPLAELLGAHHVIATALEFRDGVATGGVEGEPCLGGEKLRRAARLVASLEGDLNDAVFYSDSHHDEPLMMACGRAVAVNPDKRLRAIARREKWQILEFR